MIEQVNLVNEFLKIGLEKRGMMIFFKEHAIIDVAHQISQEGAIAIVTGFPIIECQVGETDGPLGAMSLAIALQKIGKVVYIITDQFNIKLMERTCQLLQINVPILSMEVLNLSNDKKATQWLIKHGIRQVIFIERPGVGKNNKFFNMKGEDVSSIVYPVETFLQSAKGLKISTIGIGDGGNEIGMGNLYDFSNDQTLIRECNSITRTDWLLICGISNMGAYGIIKMLEEIYQRQLACSLEFKKSMLTNFVDAGGVDGVTKRQDYSVDGMAMNEYLSNYEQLFFKDVIK